MLFGAWAEDWWLTTTNLRRSTRLRNRGYLERYLLPRFAGEPLSALNQAMIRTWVNELTARGLAPATVTLAYGLLSRILAAAVMLVSSSHPRANESGCPKSKERRCAF
jgi:hypothetical protein